MRQRRSPCTGRRYPLAMICGVYRLARSSVYAATPAMPAVPARKRGPKTAVSDADLVTEIRAVLAACPFHGEGYRKVRARLAHRGYAASGKRVFRLMRAHGLLAPRRLGPPNGNPAHDGTITTDRLDVVWGTDGTDFYTEAEGWCWFFGAIDHHLDEIVGWHVAKLGDRWAALEPIRQGVRHAFGRFGKVDLPRFRRHRGYGRTFALLGPRHGAARTPGLSAKRSSAVSPRASEQVSRSRRSHAASISAVGSTGSPDPSGQPSAVGLLPPARPRSCRPGPVAGRARGGNRAGAFHACFRIRAGLSAGPVGATRAMNRRGSLDDGETNGV